MRSSKRRGPLPAELALRLILQAAQGLAAASTRGLIHRDIKPANLMLVHPEDGSEADDDDELLVKVIDFGLAKYLNKPGEDSDISLTGDRIVGTPYYMSPEQIDPVGKEIDARADIYSLGVTLWHLLCGNPPFRGTEFQVLSQHMHNTLPWEQLPASVPSSIYDLLERMMAKDPRQSAGEPSGTGRPHQTAIADAGGWRGAQCGDAFGGGGGTVADAGGGRTILRPTGAARGFFAGGRTGPPRQADDRRGPGFVEFACPGGGRQTRAGRANLRPDARADFRALRHPAAHRGGPVPRRVWRRGRPHNWKSPPRRGPMPR